MTVSQLLLILWLHNGDVAHQNYKQTYFIQTLPFISTKCTQYVKYMHLSPTVPFYMFRCLLHHLQVHHCVTCSKTVAILSGHGKTRAYLHRFKLRDYTTCICGQGDQTTDHLLFYCKKTHTQREVLKQHIIKKGNWPASKQELVSKYRKLFSAFIESLDFELLQ
jgi:hypothetical protein